VVNQLTPSSVVALTVLVGALLTGCEGTPRAAQSPQPVDSQVPALDEGGPLPGLPECEPPTEGQSAADANVSGLLLPPGAIVTEVERDGPLVSVRAYVEATPIRIREFYQAQSALKLLQIEDEVYEAEAFYERGAHRAFVTARASCPEGSLIVAVVGPSGAAPKPTFGGG